MRRVVRPFRGGSPSAERASDSPGGPTTDHGEHEPSDAERTRTRPGRRRCVGTEEVATGNCSPVRVGPLTDDVEHRSAKVGIGRRWPRVRPVRRCGGTGGDLHAIGMDARSAERHRLVIGVPHHDARRRRPHRPCGSPPESARDRDRRIRSERDLGVARERRPEREEVHRAGGAARRRTAREPGLDPELDGVETTGRPGEACREEDAVETSRPVGGALRVRGERLDGVPRFSPRRGDRGKRAGERSAARRRRADDEDVHRRAPKRSRKCSIVSSTVGHVYCASTYSLPFAASASAAFGASARNRRQCANSNSSA